MIEPLDGYVVRPAGLYDADRCVSLCMRVHGFTREGEIRDAIARATARVVEREGILVAYATDLSFGGHAVAENNDGIKALLGSAPRFGGPGVLVPLSNSSLLSWCLSMDMQVIQLETLMTQGKYETPAESYLPSITY